MRAIWCSLADQILPGHVGGMRLAGEQEQHRALRVAENFAQPVEVFEQQRGALVGGEAAREADGEHVRIDLDRRSAAAGPGALPSRDCGNAGATMR